MLYIRMLLIVGFASVITMQGYTQMPAPKTAEVATKMDALPLKPGIWKGSGWMMMGKERQDFEITEHITPKLDGSVFIVEGIGESKEAITHHALAFLSFDPFRQTYIFHSFKDGYYVQADCELLANGAFEWRMTNLQGIVRYQVRLDDENIWHESGEFSPDKGENWYPFMDMQLTKKE